MNIAPRTFHFSKRDDSGDKPSFHTVLAHCADVGAVAECILTVTTLGNRLTRGVQKSLCSGQIQRLAAIAALHDLGKYAPCFQAKIRQLG